MAAGFWGSREAQAGRVVVFEILVDGQVVLEVIRLDQGEPAATAWTYLKSTPAENPAKHRVLAADDEARINAFVAQLDKQGPTTATLKGKCRIFCRYAGDVTVDELRLVRKDRNSPWFVDPAQVDELAKKRVVDAAMRTRKQVDAAK